MTGSAALAVIGAGASGMAAAIAAARTAPGGGQRILLLERLPRAGKKLLATGNGRCNLSNRSAPAHPYHNRAFALPALRAFEAERFFRSLGLLLAEDGEGRLYPRSNTAASVLDALRLGVARHSVELCCDQPVATVQRRGSGFLINGALQAARVILATGGCAAPAQGSDGSGFALLEALGHRIFPPRPALVQLKASAPLLPPLRGLRVKCAAALEDPQGRALCRAKGEILFAQDGISGIAAMELSRAARPGCTLALDLIPELALPALEHFFIRLCQDCPELSPAQALAGLLPRRVGEAVLRQSGIGKAAIAALSTGEISRLCAAVKRFTFPLDGTRGFAQAQVTAGGAEVSQFDPRTLESRLAPGLYACGELLDVDGGC
ncbi:MAG: aminoacetone oxidase family FAD-binding enzyme, partial [Oscillospiraceae bacterium]|nr:aminoacetone oxidase family FAD-binding enzyme [Oscillospiraceae bacterium]